MIYFLIYISSVTVSRSIYPSSKCVRISSVKSGKMGVKCSQIQHKSIQISGNSIEKLSTPSTRSNGIAYIFIESDVCACDKITF